MSLHMNEELDSVKNKMTGSLAEQFFFEALSYLELAERNMKITAMMMEETND